MPHTQKKSVNATVIVVDNWIVEIGEGKFIEWKEKNFKTKHIEDTINLCTHFRKIM